jgi:ParB family chromosome partitioning protein
MSNRRNALGRGLGALLPGTSAEAPTAAVREAVRDATREAEAAAAAEAPTSELPIDLIDPNPEQPRRVFQEEELERLASSIRQHGVLQPVVVRKAGDRYELVVGERRWRASQQAGLTTLPVVVSDVEPRDRLALALIENVQRADLNPIELAHAFRALADTGATQEQIGERVGFDRSTISNHLRLLELPRELQLDVEEGRLTTGHAKALLGLSNPERRRHLRDRIVREGLSVRAAENLVTRKPAKRSSSGSRPATDPDLQRVIDSLRQRFQTRVRIQGEAARGRIEIEFFGEDDLARITELLLN